jgi:hypothetical protein
MIKSLSLLIILFANSPLFSQVLISPIASMSSFGQAKILDKGEVDYHNLLFSNNHVKFGVSDRLTAGIGNSYYFENMYSVADLSYVVSRSENSTLALGTANYISDLNSYWASFTWSGNISVIYERETENGGALLCVLSRWKSDNAFESILPQVMLYAEGPVNHLGWRFFSEWTYTELMRYTYQSYDGTQHYHSSLKSNLLFASTGVIYHQGAHSVKACAMATAWSTLYNTGRKREIGLVPLFAYSYKIAEARLD